MPRGRRGRWRLRRRRHQPPRCPCGGAPGSGARRNPPPCGEPTPIAPAWRAPPPWPATGPTNPRGATHSDPR
eukprot:5433125-Lingulodinium_polyedra.AAC.1